VRLKLNNLICAVLLLNVTDVFGRINWEFEFVNGAIPNNAWPCGNENDDVLFACTAEVEGSLMIGKLYPRYGGCFIGYYGQEVVRTQYGVAIGTGRWVSSNGNVPASSVVGGYEGGSFQFVCRAWVDGALLVGKFVPFQGLCYTALKGREYQSQNFEVLTNQ
jgi:Protein of unknown function (DUF3421)